MQSIYLFKQKFPLIPAQNHIIDKCGRYLHLENHTVFCLNGALEAMFSTLADCYPSRLECCIKIKLTENMERAIATSLHCN